LSRVGSRRNRRMSSDRPRKSRENETRCECGEMDRHVAEAYFPIVRDEETAAHRLLSCDSRWTTPLNYCFACGGRLPAEEK